MLESPDQEVQGPLCVYLLRYLTAASRTFHLLGDESTVMFVYGINVLL